MTEDREAEALARWLEQPPGSPPPDDLDADVVEAILALRPERARAPALTADDILASVTRGPLAPGQDGGDVVDLEAFRRHGNAALPARPAATERVTARRRWWAGANRWGGLGVVVATAATLVIIALPVLRSAEDATAPATQASPSPEQADVPAEPPRSAEPAAEPAQAPVTLAKEPAGDADTPSPAMQAPPAPPMVASKPTDASSVEGRASRADAPELDAVADAADLEAEPVYRMQEQAVAADDVIPEAAVARESERLVAPSAAPPVEIARAERAAKQEPRRREEKREAQEQAKVAEAAPEEATAGAVATGAAVSGGAVADEAASTVSPYGARAAAVPTDLGSAWRRSVDALTLGRIDEANRVADAEERAGNLVGAAEVLLPLVAPPAEAGQVQASRAASLYLQAGQLQAARSVAQQGLALSASNTAARSALLVTYGDVLLALGETDGAVRAWTDAAALNGAR